MAVRTNHWRIIFYFQRVASKHSISSCNVEFTGRKVLLFTPNFSKQQQQTRFRFLSISHIVGLVLIAIRVENVSAIYVVRLCVYIRKLNCCGFCINISEISSQITSKNDNFKRVFNFQIKRCHTAFSILFKGLK